MEQPVEDELQFPGHLSYGRMCKKEKYFLRNEVDACFNVHPHAEIEMHLWSAVGEKKLVAHHKRRASVWT